MAMVEPRSNTGVDTKLLDQMEKRFSREGIRRRRRRRYQSLSWLLWVNSIAGAKRAFDLAFSTVLLVLLAPVLLGMYGSQRLRGARVVHAPRLGRWGLVFSEYSFASGPGRRLPAIVNVWRGEMSLVGPRPVAPGAVSAAERLSWKRFNARPGLLCLWWVRSRTNIAYGTEAGADAEYVETQSFFGDLGIALRALPASVYGGGGVSSAPDRVTLLGVTVNNLTMDEAVVEILHRSHGDVPSQICFVNADCANIAWSDEEYRGILRRSACVLADGIGMKLAGKLLNRNIRQNVNGTDLLPRLCKVLEEEGTGLYLLGGRPGVPEDVARWMIGDFPALRVCGVHHGYFSATEEAAVVADIRASGAAVLLVAFGVPRQERWIASHLGQTGAKVAMGVGGLFDFYSGRMPRAPQWVRELGMEWFYRFRQEPRRMWRRYFLGNAVFLSRVVREKLRSEEAL